MNLTVVTPPIQPLISLADAKLALRVDHDADDLLIVQLIEAATWEAQTHAARAFVTQTLELPLDAWPADGVVRLWWPPVQSVVSVKYYDADNVEQSVNSADYIAIVDVQPAIVVPARNKAWPTSLRDYSPIRIRYIAGYGTPAAVAAAQPDLVAYVKGLVQVDYEHRDQISNQGHEQRERLLNALKSKWGWAG